LFYLDTNVFAHAEEEGAVDGLVCWARRNKVRVLLSEVHLGEALAIKDPLGRAARVDLLASMPGKWLRPAGYLQSIEVVNEIRRIKPHWRRLPVGDDGYVRALLQAHQDGWRALRRRALPMMEKTHAAYRAVEEPAIARSRASQQLMRDHLRGEVATASEVIMGTDRFEIDPPLDLTTLDGFCRYESLAAWWGALFERLPTLADYTNHTEPYLDLSTVGGKDFVGFWLYEADLRRMPRGLSSSAVVFGQLDAKIGHGNAADARHAGYFPDADVFVTEDEAFQRALRLVSGELELREPLLVDRAKPLLAQLPGV
jgi:hypothetical protein